MKSVLTDDMTKCYVCGNPYVDVHHCIHGNGRRQIADRYKMVVPLCRKHHEEAHHNKIIDGYFKQLAQTWYEENIGTRQDFIEEFGKSWKN